MSNNKMSLLYLRINLTTIPIKSQHLQHNNNDKNDNNNDKNNQSVFHKNKYRKDKNDKNENDWSKFAANVYQHFQRECHGSNIEFKFKSNKRPQELLYQLV